jgi:hypothetical protein
MAEGGRGGVTTIRACVTTIWLLNFHEGIIAVPEYANDWHSVRRPGRICTHRVSMLRRLSPPATSAPIRVSSSRESSVPVSARVKAASQECQARHRHTQQQLLPRPRAPFPHAHTHTQSGRGDGAARHERERVDEAVAARDGARHGWQPPTTKKQGGLTGGGTAHGARRLARTCGAVRASTRGRTRSPQTVHRDEATVVVGQPSWDAQRCARCESYGKKSRIGFRCV